MAATETPKKEVPFAERRDDLLRRFGLLSCAEVRAHLNREAGLTDDARLRYVEEYGASLRDLCREVAREAHTNGEATVNALLDVGAATLAQLRIGVLSYGEQLLLQSARTVERAAVYEDCLQAMRAGADCDALWQLEAELRARLKSLPGWSNKIWSYVGNGLKVISEGGKIVLSTVKDGVVVVLRGAWQLFHVLLPYILRLSSYVFTSPRAAVLAFMFAKQMQRNLCRYLSRTFLHVAVSKLPRASSGGAPFGDQLRGMVDLAGDHVRNVGVSQIVEGLGREVHRTLVTNSGALIDTGVSLTAAFIPGGSLVAPFVGNLIKGAVAIGADAARDAAEFAVYHNDLENAFGRLYEILSLQECRQAWQASTLEASRYARYQRNRSRIESMSAADYLRVRIPEIYQQTPADLPEGSRNAIAKKQAEDELRIHEHELRQASTRADAAGSGSSFAKRRRK